MKSSIKPKNKKYLYAVFTADEARHSCYNLTGEVPAGFPFIWFRVSDSQNAFLRNQGAEKVAESFENGRKILFSGLRRVGSMLWWEGNRCNDREKSLILFRYHIDKKDFDVYIFPKYYPERESARNKFIWLFTTTREKEMSETHAPDKSNVQSNIGHPDVYVNKDNANL